MSKRLKISTKDIAIAAIFLSLILIFVLVPIPMPSGLSLAVVPLIAVILAADVSGLGMGIFAGTAFGLASFANAFLHPGVLAPMLYNPLVSIVPRMIIPITTYFIFRLMKKLLRKQSDDASTYVAATVSAAVGVVTNTGLVLSMMAAFNFGKVFGSTTIDAAFFGGLLGLNFLFEISICSLLAPILTTALRIALRLDKRGGKKIPVTDAQMPSIVEPTSNASLSETTVEPAAEDAEKGEEKGE